LAEHNLKLRKTTNSIPSFGLFAVI
jgi:hypothetical protein